MKTIQLTPSTQNRLGVIPYSNKRKVMAESASTLIRIVPLTRKMFT